jgi:L-ascorbate metabolism protein UlaG (beta-lactamase superfamily)
MDVKLGKALSEYTKKAPNRNPRKNIEVDKIKDDFFENYNDTTTRITWFGHSAFLMEIDGKKLLLDPMLGKAAAPHPMLGPNRYSEELPLKIEDMPEIDAVIFSHDHYDHLDYTSVKELKDKVGVFYTPLGVGAHLQAWGVPGEKIIELDWWDKTEFEGLELICTPARHFSGRGLFDRATTLWASWIIRGERHKVYFSGDSGYGKHFKEIGEKYGPFDISLMECGQYNEDWKYIHMMPEETVMGSIDLKSKLVLPIHWGAFTLAFHDWTDPVVRARKKAQELDFPIATPRIGQALILGDTGIPNEQWWLEYTSP